MINHNKKNGYIFIFGCFLISLRLILLSVLYQITWSQNLLNVFKRQVYNQQNKV
jgi:hypothetical protein